MFIRLRHYAVPAAIAVLLATIATFMIWNTTKPVAVKSSKQHGWTSSGCADPTWYFLGPTINRDVQYDKCWYTDGTALQLKGLDGVLRTCRKTYEYRYVRNHDTKVSIGRQLYCDGAGWY